MSDQPIHLWPGWQVNHVIGSGSYGKVYEIRRQTGDFLEKAALKVIHIPKDRSELEQLRMDGLRPENTESYFKNQVEEIRNEIGVMQRFVGNSNIVSYEDYRIDRLEREAGWDILIRMELLTALPSYMESHPMSEKDVFRLGMDICNALTLCHEAGIIHRDIKPQNIFVNEWGAFKLGDFGIARSMPKSGSVMSFKGTPSYMAPETFRMQDTDARSDIYSLALVLYRILNGGREPFLFTNSYTPQEKEEAQRRRLLGEMIPPPERGSRELWRVLSVALHEDPSYRYQTAAIFYEALKAIGRSKAEKIHSMDEEGTISIINKHKNEKMPLYQDEARKDITKSLFIDDGRKNRNGAKASSKGLYDGYLNYGAPADGASLERGTKSHLRNNNNDQNRNYRNGNPVNRNNRSEDRTKDMKKSLSVWLAVVAAIILLVAGTATVTYWFLESKSGSGQDGNPAPVQNTGSKSDSESGDDPGSGSQSEEGTLQKDSQEELGGVQGDLTAISQEQLISEDNESAETPYVSYSFSCVDKEGNDIGGAVPNYMGKRKAGDIMTFIAPEIEGYTLVGENEREIVLSENEDENTQIFTYIKNPDPIAYNTKGSVRILNRKSDKNRVFEYLAKRFEKESGIKVTIETPESGEYSTALKERITGSANGPTLFMLSGMKDFEKYGNKCLNLTNTAVAGEICDEAYTLKGKDRETYGLAFILEAYGITVNTRLLSKAGYEISDIRGFADLKEIAEDISSRKRELGFTAFTTPTIGKGSSGNYRLTRHASVIPLYYELMDNGFLTDQKLKGIYLDGFRDYVDLCLNNSVGSRADAKSYSLEDARQEFREGRAVFHQDGSWGYKTLHDALGEDMAVIPMYMGIPGEEYQALSETCSYYWCVNKNASYDDAEASLQFLQWLVTSEEGTDITEEDMDFQMPYKKARVPDNIYLQTLQKQKEEGLLPVLQYYNRGNEESWANALTKAMEAYAVGTGGWDVVKRAFISLW